MKLFRNVLCSSILLASTIASWAQTDGGPLAYPKAKTVDQVDDYTEPRSPILTAGWKTRTARTQRHGCRKRIS